MRVRQGGNRHDYPAHKPQSTNGSTHCSGIVVYILPDGADGRGRKQKG